MIYSSWDIEQNILKLVILGHFLPFYPLKTPKIKILKKWITLLEISSFYTCAPKIIILWCMVPEIWSATDRIFCQYGLFFALFSPMDPENQNFEKMNKTFEDTIILKMFIINDSHMIYGFSDMECNRQIFLSFWTIFCPFTL